MGTHRNLDTAPKISVNLSCCVNISMSLSVCLPLELIPIWIGYSMSIISDVMQICLLCNINTHCSLIATTVQRQLSHNSPSRSPLLFSPFVFGFLTTFCFCQSSHPPTRRTIFFYTVDRQTKIVPPINAYCSFLDSALPIFDQKLELCVFMRNILEIKFVSYFFMNYNNNN